MLGKKPIKANFDLIDEAEYDLEHCLSNRNFQLANCLIKKAQKTKDKKEYAITMLVLSILIFSPFINKKAGNA